MTTHGDLQAWWEALSDGERQRLRSIDLDDELPSDVVPIMLRLRPLPGVVGTAWERQPFSYHAVGEVRDFVLKQGD